MALIPCHPLDLVVDGTQARVAVAFSNYGGDSVGAIYPDPPLNLPVGTEFTLFRGDTAVYRGKITKVSSVLSDCAGTILAGKKAAK